MDPATAVALAALVEALVKEGGETLRAWLQDEDNRPRPRRLLLQIGVRGPLTRAVQQRLNATGYPIGIDGIYGEETRSAVVQYQASAGLAPDGLCGPDTLSALFGSSGSSSTRS